MRVFTKMSKVPFSHLRRLDHNSVVYVDDLYFQGYTYESCLNNVLDTLHCLSRICYFIQKDDIVSD